jgi:hypothetical protein
MHGRIADFEWFVRQHPSIPSLREAARSAEWAWRFVGALGHRLLTGELDKLWELAAEDAPGSPGHVAVTMTLAADLVAGGAGG